MHSENMQKLEAFEQLIINTEDHTIDEPTFTDASREMDKIRQKIDEEEDPYLK